MLTWPPTSSWFTFIYSQTCLRTSACDISLSEIPKKFASASDIITTGTASSHLLPDSSSVFALLGFWAVCSVHVITNWQFYLRVRIARTKNREKTIAGGIILEGSRVTICLASSLFILNISVQSVSNTKRSSSLQIIFLLLFGSWRLCFLMYAHSCLTIWVGKEKFKQKN